MLAVWLGVLVLTASATGGDVETFAVAGFGACNGDYNATMKACPYPCPRTCNNLRSFQSCAVRTCPNFGCECNPGYVVSPRGRCILPKDCPAKCPRNAVFKRCPSPCPPTCYNVSGRYCTGPCVEYGCECKKGYVLTPTGKCIKRNKCPAARYCSRNETFVTCEVNCPSEFCPVNDGRARVACAVAQPCPSGCACKANYRRQSRADGRCILASDCPPVKCKRPNEVWNSCPPNCLAERCDDLGRNQSRCPSPYHCDPQCVCKPGYYRNDSDICVPAKECRKCSPNAVYKKYPSPCPGTCDNPSGDWPCSKAGVEYGCECMPGYVLFNGKCILLNECPAAKSCKKNETFAACKVECPSEFCPMNDNRARVACSIAYPCPSGCVCKANHLRMSQADDKCILASDCPPVKCKRPNEVWNSCPPNCLAERCDDIGRNQTKCPLPYYCAPQCVCKPGFYRNDSDICVPANECRKCPPNAVYKKNPSPCPGTCDNPSGDRPCSKAGVEYGCECMPGYVLFNGKCILLNECPAAKSCKKNETFVACKAECPNNYCPEKDTTGIIACDPPYPCRSGCVCQANHRRLSQNDTRCILATDCPSLKCKRPNEEWNRCPSNCLAERCEDINNNQTDCIRPYSYCDPKCVCKEGYYRNSSDICVPASDCVESCPIKPDCRSTCAVPNPQNCAYNVPPVTNVNGCQCQEGYILSKTYGECIKIAECPPQSCPISTECRRTCSVPNPPDCPITEPSKTNENGCQCQAGYVLSDPEGECIEIEKCPRNQGCNGDSRAVITKTPWPCPSTCAAPNTIMCRKAAQDFGCQCEPGYLLSELNGKCILPEKCSCGNPCGENGTFSDCGFKCPNQYCPEDDSLVRYACKPGRPCPPGCLCKENYKTKSYEDDTCVLASDCPPVNCTRDNEVWDSCPRVVEYCKHINSTENQYLPTNCEPTCVCIKGYYRDESDACIPEDECKK